LIKAILLEANIAFPKTHDIAALAGLLPTTHVLKVRLEKLASLTPYGIAYRYPSEDDWELPAAESIETWRLEIESIR
jgi:HEPN domain-containing protein